MLAENFLQTDASSSCNSWLFHTHNATALFSVEAAGGLATALDFVLLHPTKEINAQLAGG